MLQLSLPKRLSEFIAPDLLELQASCDSHTVLDERSSFAEKLKAAYEGGLVHKAELISVCKETIEIFATSVDLPALVTRALEELVEAPAELSLSLIKGLMAGSSKVQTSQIGAYKNLPDLSLKIENSWKRIHPKTLSLLTNFKLLQLTSNE